MTKNLKAYDNDELLDIYIDAFETYQDYLRREDYLIWTDESEERAHEYFIAIKDEILRRMGENDNS